MIFLLKTLSQVFSHARRKYLLVWQVHLASYILAKTVLAQDKISFLHLLELNLFVILIYKKQKSFGMLTIKSKRNLPFGKALVLGI